MLPHFLRLQFPNSVSKWIAVLMLASAILISPLPLTSSFAQSSKTVDLTLRLEQESDPILSEVPTGSNLDETASVKPSIAIFDLKTRKFKGVTKGSADYKIVYKEGEKIHTQAGKITVQGVQKWVIKHNDKEYDGSEAIRSSEGSKGEIEARAIMEDGDDITSGVTLKSSDTKVFDIETSATAKKLVAKAVGIGTLTIKLGEEKKQFSVEILEPIDKTKSDAALGKLSLEIPEGGADFTVPEWKFKTVGDKDVSMDTAGRDFSITVNPADAKLIQAEGYKVRANRVDSSVHKGSTVKVAAKLVTNQGIKDGKAETLEFPVEITVVVQEATVTFDPPTKILFEDETATLKAYIRARDGQPLTTKKLKAFKFTRSCDKKFVELIPDLDNNSVTVVRRLLEDSEDESLKDCSDKEPGSIAIEAEAQNINGEGPTYKGIAVLRLRRVKGFHPLSVKINIVDKQTAEDLYGRVAHNEYYILTVRMFNDLKDDETGKFTGDAIIVYSGSIELAVNLEKQYDEKSKSAKKKTNKNESDTKASYIADGRWYEVDPLEDLKGIIDPAYSKADLLDKQKVLSHSQDNVCKGTITYRPLTFEMVVNTVDRRDKRSRRSRVFDALELVGLGASFSSAIRFPRPGRDLPIMTDSLSNLLVPGLEKVFPSFKEQNRQNIVSQVMKPLEEVPFGSDLTRVLFVPKRSIRGIIPDHKARISQICPFYFKVNVAVVDKKGQATVNQATR